MRPIQFHLSKFWNQNTDPPKQMVPLYQSVKVILKWWQVWESLNQGIPLEPPPFIHHLFTGASKKSWGAYLQDTTCQGGWSELETKFHINILTLSHFNISPMFHVLVASDNITVIAYINRVGGTRSWSLWKEAEFLFSLATTLNISIHARFIPGRMNVITDELLRAG